MTTTATARPADIQRPSRRVCVNQKKLMGEACFSMIDRHVCVHFRLHIPSFDVVLGATVPDNASIPGGLEGWSCWRNIVRENQITVLCIVELDCFVFVEHRANCTISGLGGYRRGRGFAAQCTCNTSMRDATGFGIGPCTMHGEIDVDGTKLPTT
jgi:hypothetical protein